MRISTSQMYQNGATSLMNGQSSLYKLQNQLSTGKKFLSAQEDPVGCTVAHSTFLGVGAGRCEALERPLRARLDREVDVLAGG